MCGRALLAPRSGVWHCVELLPSEASARVVPSACFILTITTCAVVRGKSRTSCSSARDSSRRQANSQRRSWKRRSTIPASRQAACHAVLIDATRPPTSSPNTNGSGGSGSPSGSVRSISRTARSRWPIGTTCVTARLRLVGARHERVELIACVPSTDTGRLPAHVPLSRQERRRRSRREPVQWTSRTVNAGTWPRSRLSSACRAFRSSPLAASPSLRQRP